MKNLLSRVASLIKLEKNELNAAGCGFFFGLILGALMGGQAVIITMFVLYGILRFHQYASKAKLYDRTRAAIIAFRNTDGPSGD